MRVASRLGDHVCLAGPLPCCLVGLLACVVCVFLFIFKTGNILASALGRPKASFLIRRIVPPFFFTIEFYNAGKHEPKRYCVGV